MHLTVILLLTLARAAFAVQSPAPQDSFVFQPDGAAGPAAGDRLGGFVGYRNSPRLAQAYDDAGARTALYRRTVFLNERENYRYIGEDFRDAQARGRRPWLGVVGTPQILSPHPNETGNSYGTGLPEYARYMPTDATAWADEVLDFIGDMETDYGVVPEFVELWNEPDRVEWFTGTAPEFLRFYGEAAARIRAVRPGMLVGGPGLAGVTSTLDLEQGFLWGLVAFAGSVGAPLDFVSWHHYAPANELHHTGAVQSLKALARSVSLGTMACVVSEWNIYPSAQGPFGAEFDGSHAAANMAGFVTSAYELGLDGNMFFLDLDESNDPGITDLAGVGLGALTHHGIKKPVFRIAEFLFGMSAEEILPVTAPASEVSLRVLVSRAGNRVRILASNDAVSPHWVFVARSQENGMDPGWLYPRWLAAGGRRASVQSLVQVGLTVQQAIAVLMFMPEVFEADRYEVEPRVLTITLSGTAPVTLGDAWRFDATHHAPAAQRTLILPWVELVENGAQRSAASVTAVYLTGEGYPYSTQELLAIQGDFLDWAAQEGIPYGIAVEALKLMRDTLRDERLAYMGQLNTLPETELRAETAAAAGVVLAGRTITMTIEPNGVSVLDLGL